MNLLAIRADRYAEAAAQIPQRNRDPKPEKYASDKLRAGRPVWSSEKDEEGMEMPKKGHGEEQILRALRQTESGTKVSDICREHGISDATFYIWKKKYSGFGFERTSRAAAVARGERQAQAAGGGPVAGPAYPAGDRAKKAVKPRHRRELGQRTQTVFVLSGRGGADADHSQDLGLPQSAASPGRLA